MRIPRAARIVTVAVVAVTGTFAWWLETGPADRPPAPREFSRPHATPTAAEEAGLEPERLVAPVAPSASPPITRAIPPVPPSAASQSLRRQVLALQPPPAPPQPQETATNLMEVPPTSGAAENNGVTPGDTRAPATTRDESGTVIHPPVLRDVGRLDYPAAGYHIVVEGFRPQAHVDAIQGRVVLKILVRADGTVGAVEVFESSGNPALDEAAALAARNWTFMSATRDDAPIDAWAVIPVRFVTP